MKRLILCFAVLVLLYAALWGLSKDDVKISTSDGRSIQGTVYKPEAISSPCPVVVIAPGSGYHRGLPLVAGFAQRCAEEGMIAVTFDWHYFSEKGKISEGWVREKEDIAAVAAYARSLKETDKENLVLVGKSFGSVIAWNYFRQDKALKALILLTPVIPDEEYEAKLYPGLGEEKRPVVMGLGASDDDNGPLEQIYRTLDRCEKKIPVFILPGDHGMNVGAWDDSRYKGINEYNNQLAVDIALHWITVILERY